MPNPNTNAAALTRIRPGEVPGRRAGSAAESATTISFARESSQPAEKAGAEVGSSRLSPHVLPLVLERADSPYRFLHLVDVLEICERFREVLSRLGGDPGPQLAETIAGCDKARQRVGPRVALVPMALVGHPRADGRLLGMGLALRKSATLGHRRCLSAAIERVSKQGLKLGRFGRWFVHADAAGRLPESLLSETWTAHPHGATDWATVTPIVFDGQDELTEDASSHSRMGSSIRLACRRTGVPEPCEVIITPVSTHFGTPPANAFPYFSQRGTKRHHRHAILIFAQPVRGPILLGAGRDCGYGLCRPMRDET